MSAVVSAPQNAIRGADVHPGHDGPESSTFEALNAFKQIIHKSGQRTARLYCTVPTWSPFSSNCLDLHDLQNLRSRSLLIIHDLLQALQLSGIYATYHLIPTQSDVATIRLFSSGGFQILPEHLSEASNLARARGKKQALLSKICEESVIVVT